MNEEKPELIFDDLTLGREFRPLEFSVNEDRVAQYMEVVGDRHHLYRDSNRAGGAVAPPGLAAVFARLSYLQDHSMPSGGVLAKQEFEFQSPVKVGDVLTVLAHVFERYLDDKGRRRVNFKIRAFNGDREQVCLIRLYAIWPK